MFEHFQPERVFRKRLSIAILFFALGLCVNNLHAFQSLAEVDDLAVVQGLNERQLFSLAESFCRRKLKQQPANSVGKSAWTIELIKTLTLNAASSEFKARESEWAKVTQASSDFDRQSVSHPQKVLVDVQGALSKFARAHQTRQEIQAELRSISEVKSTIDLLQETSRDFKSIQRTIDSMVAAAPDRSKEDARLTKSELQNIKINISVQLARCDVDRALLMPSEQQMDRMYVLNRANIELDQVLRTTNPDQPLWWDVQLETVKIKRLQNDLAGAGRVLASLGNEQVPDSIKPRIEEEFARLFLAAGNREALQRIVNSIRLEDRRAPTFSLLLLEIALKIANDTTDEQQKGFARQQAVKLTQAIELHHGRYWARRANLMLTSSLGGESAQPSDAQILLRIATEAERKQQWQEALDAYDKAANAFQTSGLPGQEIKVRYRAGLISQQLKQYSNAFERFDAIAIQFRDSPDAPGASLLAIWNYSQTVNDQDERLNRYRELLDRHLDQWISHESAGQVQIWRGRLEARNGNYAAALNDLLQVPTTSKFFHDAIELTAKWIEPAIIETEKSGASVREYALDLAGQLESLLSDEPNQLPPEWNPSLRSVALALGKVNLLYLDDDTGPTVRMLEAAMDSSTEAEKEWRSTTAAWLVVALALDSNARDQMKTHLQKVTEPDSWSQLMAGLSALAGRTTDDGQKKILAQTQLLVSESMDKQLEGLDEKYKVKWALAKAEALETSGNRDQSIGEYERLANEYPRDAAVQVAYADALTRGETMQDWQTALSRWRIIASQSRKQSPRWFQSKYHVALLLAKTDQKQEALKLLEFINAVPPGWGKSELKSEFDRLFLQVKQTP